ncbi:MAG: IS200/IS605 family element transposase accessory protein TnpB, partial [Candidatus Helarchaeota archaeon]|nr:IS200/IS605 family element transposase accessory protein TnpB [Candidatus Helarchaeota archaeon]
SDLTRKLVNYCILGNFGKIVIGYNSGWKDKLNLGKRNNQNFVQVPFKKLVNLLKYKGRLVGIKVVLVEEWYTSKTSALDLEPIQKSKNYLGKRVHRGLFLTKNKIKINADVNAALNILRKYVGNEFIKQKKEFGCWLQPKTWRAYENLNSKKGKSNQLVVDSGVVNSPWPQSPKKRNEGMNSINGNCSAC